MKNSLKIISLFASSILISNAVEAKDTKNISEKPKQENEISVSEVTVVATKTERRVQDVPQMVTVEDVTKAGVSNATSVSDALRNVTGLNFVGGPVRSGQTPNMRGWDSTSLLITLDGRRQQFESSHDGRFFIDPSLLKKVEVVRGPASAIHGSGGLGGVVAFETKDAKDFLENGKTEGAQVTVGAQTANEEGYGILTGYKVGENYDAVASILGRSSEDIELSNDNTQRSDDRITSGMAKIGYDINDYTNIKFALNSFINHAKENTNPQVTPPTQTTGLNLVDKEIIQQEGSIKYRTNPSDLIDFKAHLYAVDTGVEERILEASSLNPVGDNLDREMTTIGLNLDNTSKFNNHSLSYGLEFYTTDQEGKDNDSDANGGVTGGQRSGVPNASQQVYGGFVQDEIIFDLAEQTQLYINPAIRYDVFETEADNSALKESKDSRFSPRIGSTLKFLENYNVFGSYSHGFRAPNLTEIYAQGNHFGAGFGYFNQFQANPYLKPEVSKTLEVGTGFEFSDVLESSDELKFKFARYKTGAQDYIEQYITGPNYGVPPCNFPFVHPSCNGGITLFRNVNKARIWGYEITTGYENSFLTASLGASYVSAKDADTGTYLTTKQPLIVTSDIGYKFADEQFTIGHFGKYAADNKKALIDVPSQINYVRPGFATHGAYLRYEPKKLENLTIDFAVDNIFNKQYREPFFELYAPETNFRLSATYKW
ncbi:MAG TPA: hypothetical protein DIV86_04120 [Alphaproteobacteria bacterium]|nr:hypothetical protein [Alphaproteobacteria bacterium]